MLDGSADRVILEKLGPPIDGCWCNFEQERPGKLRAERPKAEERRRKIGRD